MSPTERTMKALKEKGFSCGIVERYISQVWNSNGKRGIRKDLFSIIDIIALDHSSGVIGVQSTGEDYSGHDKKLRLEKRYECIDWLLTPGAHLELYSWRKIKKEKGSKIEIWAPRVKVYSLADFDIDPLGL